LNILPENAAAYGNILGIDSQGHPLMSIDMLLNGDSGTNISAGKPHPIPIAISL